MKTVPWILFAVALVILMVQNMCNRPAPAESMVSKNQFEALQSRYNDTLSEYHQFRLWSDSALNNSIASAIQANDRAAASLAQRYHALQQISQLLVKLDSAAKEKPDSSWVQVSPRYREGCDSLRAANLTLNYRILQADQDNQAHVDALNYETRIRDSVIQKEREFNAQFRQQLADCLTTGKQQEKTGRPRNQLYGGIAAWGSQLSPFGGGEINLALKTKNDAIYEVKGAYLLNTWWVGVGTKFKFHF